MPAVPNTNFPTGLSDGLYAFVKRACDTCSLVHPLLPALPLQALYVQDDPESFADCKPIDDTALKQSFRFVIETVPTLLRIQGGRETARAEGWVQPKSATPVVGRHCRHGLDHAARLEAVHQGFGHLDVARVRLQMVKYSQTDWLKIAAGKRWLL